MPPHDAYARLTPYELSFPNLAWCRERFAEVREEAQFRDVDAGDPGRFVLLGSVGKMLRELRGADEEAERIHSHGLLLYHAFHFWEAGEVLVLVDVAASRRAVDVNEVEAPTRALPASAGYMQLPQHLFWTGGDEGAPESLDGFFWSSPARASELRLLLVAGLRGGRPGFSVVPIPPVGIAELTVWFGAAGREEGRDFASAMPGADLEGLYQLTTPVEALKLAARLWFLPELERMERRAPPVTASPAPTTLPYATVTLR